jgi:lysyl endopeptidase
VMMNNYFPYQIRTPLVFLIAFLSFMGNKTFAQVKIVKDTKNEFTSGNARSESCYPCINGEYWKQAKRSVVRILVFNEDNTMMCTGVLINNTGMDAKPYVLTAHHCISDQAEADRAIFTFNHDDVNCDGNLPASATSLFGGVLRAHSYEHDFALIEMNDHVPLGFHPYFSGWNISHTQFDQVSCIHHPLAEPKKVSVQNQQIVTSDFVVEGKPNRAANAFWHVKDWDVGYTERGSSGAPLFNKQQQVIGTLSGGESSCSNPHDDFFARLSESWEASADSAAQLKCWLDPNSTGKKILDGFDPLGGRYVVCDTFSNIIRDESIGIIPYEAGTGYFTGCNSGNVKAFAESFIVEDSSFLTGINISIGSLSQASQGGIHVSVHADGGGVPGELLFEKFLPYNTLHLNRNYIELYPFVTVSGRFFVSYSPSCSVGDEFAVEQAYWRSSSVNNL